MVRRNHNIYPVTEIIPASKLKILLSEKDEKLLVIRRTEKGLLITGLRGYLEGLKRGKRNRDPFVT